MEHVSIEQLLLEDMQKIIELLDECKSEELQIIQAISITNDAIEKLALLKD